MAKRKKKMGIVEDNENVQDSGDNDSSVPETSNQEAQSHGSEATETPVQETVAEPMTPVIPEPILQPVPAPVVVPVAAVDIKPAATTDNLSSIGKIVLQGIDDYMVNMKPNTPISHTAGVRNQIALFRTLMMALGSLYEDFNLVYGTILKKFHDERDGVFHEINVFRFFDNIPLSVTERKTFMRLLNLIKVTADSSSRTLSLKQVDMSKTLEHLPEDAKHKLLNFYHL